MAKYTLVFKKQCVAYWKQLQEKGIVEIKTKKGIVKANNIRELVKVLEITNSSLYSWLEKFGDEAISMKEIEALIPTLEYDETYGESLDDTITMVLDNSYFMTLARALKVKNYRMPLKQLYVAIGNELIKRSGLVSNGVRKEMRLE